MIRRIWPLILVLLVSACSSAAAQAPAKNGPIVFDRFDPRLGAVRLFTVQPDGSGLAPLTTPDAAESDSQAAWSPDGRKVVFRRVVDLGLPDERADLYVVGADGKGLRNLTRATCPSPCLANEEPAWSPDGKRIAFVRVIGPMPSNGGPAPIVGIFVMNADGTHVRQVTQRKRNSGTEDHAPSWSPDGKHIAFMRSNNTALPPEASVIWIIDADGTHAKVVRVMSHKWPGSGAPAWSPDGKRILFATYCWFGDCGQARTGAQLYTVRTTGKDVRQLTHLSGNAQRGRWSPDGKKVVFAANSRVGPTGDVYTINADGSGLDRITHSPELAAQDPDWGARAP